MKQITITLTSGERKIFKDSVYAYENETKNLLIFSGVEKLSKDDSLTRLIAIFNKEHWAAMVFER